MGNFLGELHLHTKKPEFRLPQNQLLQISLTVLRQYHGSFKSICDTFAINLNEFQQIFPKMGNYGALFNIWDTDKNGLIDVLELFAGLILFANSARFEDKIYFLFDIFDFNELNSLSIIDLEFMLISCANATFKIYQIGKEVNEEEINQFLQNDFSDDLRINISQMLKWCAEKPEITEFMSLIKRTPPLSKQQIAVNTQQELEVQSLYSKKSIAQIIQSKKYKDQLEWLDQIAKKTIDQTQKDQQKNAMDIQCKIKWVYGFRCHDVKRPIQLIRHGSSEKLVYFTSNIIILYAIKERQQAH